MKLLFPNDEHEPVTLGEGTTTVGAAADSTVRLGAPGIATRHAELVTEEGQTRLRPLTDSAATVLNGKQVAGEAAIKPGDLILFGKVGARVVATPSARPAPAPPPASAGGDDPGQTRVRMAMPKYLLRGVSGPTFGKIYAMTGTLVVGRSSDADICIPIDEISRQHAKLQGAAAGAVVEDLGSANGTFVNDQRVHTPTLLKAGDEVRFDTVRFLLMSPAQEAQAAAAAARTDAASPAARSGSALWVVAGIVVLAVVAFTLLRYFAVV
jgi:pSer/pThr/pTyr-binding forkhead associated (FHA) protein